MEIWVKERGLLVLTKQGLHIAGLVEPIISMDGKTINHRAWLGSQIVQLRAQIPSVEKVSHRTPPKTLVKEWEKVKAAIELLPKLQAQLAEMETEYQTIHGKPSWDPISKSNEQ